MKSKVKFTDVPMNLVSELCMQNQIMLAVTMGTIQLNQVTICVKKRIYSYYDILMNPAVEKINVTVKVQQRNLSKFC